MSAVYLSVKSYNMCSQFCFYSLATGFTQLLSLVNTADIGGNVSDILIHSYSFVLQFISLSNLNVPNLWALFQRIQHGHTWEKDT